MNSQKRQELESKLEGKVVLWMDVSKGQFTDEVETQFLTLTDLSDKELVDLNFSLNLGNEFGSLTKEDRNESVLTLDFELR